MVNNITQIASYDIGKCYLMDGHDDWKVYELVDMNAKRIECLDKASYVYYNKANGNTFIPCSNYRACAIQGAH